jgi:hypothetical protein
MMRLLAVVLCVFLLSCAQILPALVQLGNTSKLVSSYLELIDDAADIWSQAHPEDLDGAQKLKGAIERTQLALVALEKMGTSASAYEQGDVSAAKLELLQAYSALYQIAQELGLIPGGTAIAQAGDEVGSQAAALSAKAPKQVDAITPDELEELLR